MGRVTDGKMDHDDSFPVALDQNLQRISAMEAIFWKRRDPKVPFYCPKCIQIDPNHRTIVRPSSHKIPRFNRKRKEAHLQVCQYRNAIKYLEYLAEKFQIPLQQKELHVTIPPYQAAAFMDQSLQTRRSIYEKKQHRTFMELMEALLQDYDIDLFYQRYGQYQIFDGKDRFKLKNFVRSMEKNRPDAPPDEGKLNFIIGQVYEVEWSDRYVIAILDNTRVDYTFSLYFHPYYYPKSLVDLLKGRRIACLGYVQKTDEEEFRMEILTMEHQIAFIDGPRPLGSLAPMLKADLFLDHLLSHMEPFVPLPIKNFKRSYYGHQLQQFNDQNFVEEQRKKKRLKVTLDQIPELNESILKLKVSREQLEKDLDHLQKKKSTFLLRLKDILLFRGSRVKLKEQEIEQKLQKLKEEIKQAIAEVRQLKDERTKLKEELDQFDEKRLKMVQKKKDEKKLKKRLQGFLYEYELGENRGIVMNLCPKADRFNVEVEVTLFEVQKKEGYYLPSSKIQRTFATDGFSGEREIQTMIQKIGEYIDQQVQKISKATFA